MANIEGNSLCLKCFFDVKKQIRQRSLIYLEKYGVAHEFKAGVHYGNVAAGEIGLIKKDITFSGDVLNSTVRKQEECNNFKVELLVLGGLLNLLSLKGQYQKKSPGEILLRGETIKNFIIYCPYRLMYASKKEGPNISQLS